MGNHPAAGKVPVRKAIMAILKQTWDEATEMEKNKTFETDMKFVNISLEAKCNKIIKAVYVKESEDEIIKE